jgi:general secretion pathway protein M
VITLAREQLIALGAAAAVLLACAGAAAISLAERADAVQELAVGSDLLVRLDARVKSTRDARARSGAAAPAAAFLDASTQGLAGAQMQAYLQGIAGPQHAILISSGVEPTKREDPPDSIRLQASLEAGLRDLHALLYQLESGTPYVFVESLAVQLSGGASQRDAEDPLLRITVELRAVWRQGKT